MAKRALIFIVVLYAISILNSCCTTYDNYYWRDFDIRVIDNSSIPEQMPILLDVNSPIEKKKLGFRIEPILTFSSRSQQSGAGRRPGSRFSIINEAQAISCAWWVERLHTITSIVIKAISAGSDSVSVEIDVTSLFRGRQFRNSNEISIDELILQLDRPPGFEIVSDRFDLLLRDNSIDLTGKQTFEITITFDDGVVLTQKTEELTLI